MNEKTIILRLPSNFLSRSLTRLLFPAPDAPAVNTLAFSLPSICSASPTHLNLTSVTVYGPLLASWPVYRRTSPTTPTWPEAGACSPSHSFQMLNPLLIWYATSSLPVPYLASSSFQRSSSFSFLILSSSCRRCHLRRYSSSSCFLFLDLQVTKTATAETAMTPSTVAKTRSKVVMETLPPPVPGRPPPASI